jgi:hypothetical protein
MTIVRCPRCRDELTVPPQASPAALVRCPLCLEEYLLSEALAQVPPALIVVGGAAASEATSAPSDAEYRLAGGFAGVAESTVPAFSQTVTPRSVPAGTPRTRKPSKNAAVEFIKIALGGVAGLAIGLVVLWWVFRRDPLEWGPPVSAYAPWIVPARFHRQAGGGSSEVTITPPQSRKEKPRSAEGSQREEVGAEIEQPAGLPSANSDLPQESLKPAAVELDVPPAGPAPPMPDLTDLLPDSVPSALDSPGGARPGPSAAALARAVATAATKPSPGTKWNPNSWRSRTCITPPVKPAAC